MAPRLARGNAACRTEVACSHVSGLFTQSGWTAGPDGVREPRPHHSSGIDVPMKRQASLGCVGKAARRRRRRARAKRPPQAAIRPGKPAPTTGPGTKRLIVELSEPGPAANTVNFSVTEKGPAPVLVRAEVPEAFAPDTRGPVNVVELSGVPVNKAFAVLRK